MRERGEKEGKSGVQFTSFSLKIGALAGLGWRTQPVVGHLGAHYCHRPILRWLREWRKLSWRCYCVVGVDHRTCHSSGGVVHSAADSQLLQVVSRSFGVFIGVVRLEGASRGDHAHPRRGWNLRSYPLRPSWTRVRRQGVTGWGVGTVHRLAHFKIIKGKGQ